MLTIIPNTKAMNYEEIRITVEYEGQKDPSTKQLFGEE